MKAFIKAHKFLAAIILAAAILLPILVFAIDNISDGYRIGPGISKNINLYGVNSTIPYRLTNLSADKTYFIPTRTTREFNALQTAKLPPDGYHTNEDLTLEDYCGNGLCSLIINYYDTSQRRVYTNPPLDGMVFAGFEQDSKYSDWAPIPGDYPSSLVLGVENRGPNDCCAADCGPICCGDGVCDAFRTPSKPYIIPEYYENVDICYDDCKLRCISVDYYGCTYTYTGNKYFGNGCDFGIFMPEQWQGNGFFQNHSGKEFTRCGLSNCTVDNRTYGSYPDVWLGTRITCNGEEIGFYTQDYN